MLTKMEYVVFSLKEKMEHVVSSEFHDITQPKLILKRFLWLFDGCFVIKFFWRITYYDDEIFHLIIFNVRLNVGWRKTSIVFKPDVQSLRVFGIFVIINKFVFFFLNQASSARNCGD